MKNLRELGILAVNPGDAVIAKVPDNLSMKELGDLAATLREAIPHAQIILVEPDITIESASAAQATVLRLRCALQTTATMFSAEDLRHILGDAE